MDDDGDRPDPLGLIALHRLDGQGQRLALNFCAVCAAIVVAAQTDGIQRIGDGVAAKAHACGQIGSQSAQTEGVGVGLFICHRQIAGLGGAGGGLGDRHAGADGPGGSGQGVVVCLFADEGQGGQGDGGVAPHIGTVQCAGQIGGVNGHRIVAHDPIQRHAGDRHRIGAIIGPASGDGPGDSQSFTLNGKGRAVCPLIVAHAGDGDSRRTRIGVVGIGNRIIGPRRQRLSVFDYGNSGRLRRAGVGIAAADGHSGVIQHHFPGGNGRTWAVGGRIVVIVRFQTGIESIRLIWVKPGKCGTGLPSGAVHAVLRICDGSQRDAGVLDVFLCCGGRSRGSLIRFVDGQCQWRCRLGIGIVTLCCDTGHDGVSPRIGGQTRPGGCAGIGIMDGSTKRFIVHQRYSRRCNDRLLAGIGQLLRCAAPCDRGRGPVDGELLGIGALPIPDGDGNSGFVFPRVFVVGIGHRIIRTHRQLCTSPRDGHSRRFLGAVINQVISGNRHGHAVPARRAGAGRCPAESVSTVRRSFAISAIRAFQRMGAVAVGGRLDAIVFALLHDNGAG